MRTMTYPSNFHRIVLIGTLYGTEAFNTSFSVIPRAGSGTIGLPPTADIIGPLQTLLSTYWSSPASSAGDLRMNNQAKLTTVKVNLIGPDGKYVLPTTTEYIYPTPVAGSTSVPAPAQLAAVATLRTAAERGLASKGRMYFPAPSNLDTVDPDGRIAATYALRFANSVRSLFVSVNSLYLSQQSGDEHLGRVGVASRQGSGMFREVDRVSVGRVPDTMRSRRTSLLEDPSYTAVLP